MREEWTRLFLVSCVACFLSVRANDTDVKYFTNKWLVHVPLGEIVARAVAHSNSMTYDGPDYDNEGYHVMVKNELPLKSYYHNEEITNRLNNHDLVTTASQEAVKARSHRGFVNSRHVVPRNVVPRSYNSARPRHVVPRNSKNSKLENESAYKNAFNDKFWTEMWYLQDYRTDYSQPVLDLNVVPVYFELGITGKHVNITVADDGLEWKHPDILPKFNRDISWNYILNNNNILPDLNEFGNYRAHGTRCAGEIIMQPNNRYCGVGVAYGANIGGIKFLDDSSTDAREAKVLKYNLRDICIFSNSWGPADNGLLMGHLTDLVKDSFIKGISRGRDGKGAIYVFAAGNGKEEGDNCACDGYVNSIYTIVIASCDDNGHVTHYSERCNAIMATAYSGAGAAKNVLTTDVGGKCTDRHTGTSAATPLVSGIIALGLSANPNLTWRDVQYLLAWTSQVAPLSDNYGWNRNQAGFYYSMDFGFGLVNAYKFVKEAMKWENVPEMSSCAIRMPKVKGFPVTRNEAARIIVNSNACEGSPGEVQFIEYVELVILLSYPRRGDIQIAMKSPSGTECHVLEHRPSDSSNQGLRRWTFKILAFWGETPKGKFTIDIFDKTGKASNRGVISEMTLSIHGTRHAPDIYKNGPRPYDKFTLAKPGDKPRFIHLSTNSVKYYENPNVDTDSHVNNENNQDQNDNELRKQNENTEVQDNEREGTILPNTMSHIMNAIESNHIGDVDNIRLQQETENSEMMDSNKQHTVWQKLQGLENNLADTFVQNMIPPNTMSLFQNNLLDGIDRIQNFKIMNPNDFIQMVQGANRRVNGFSQNMVPRINFF